MIDYIIMSLLLVGALFGGWYLKREAIRERKRRQTARKAEEARRREVADEWLRTRVLYWLEQYGEKEEPGRIPEVVSQAIDEGLRAPKN